MSENSSLQGAWQQFWSDVRDVYALLDNGSDVSLCDAELVKELDLQGERRDFLLTTQEKKVGAKSSLELKLTISWLDGTSALDIQKCTLSYTHGFDKCIIIYSTNV